MLQSFIRQACSVRWLKVCERTKPCQIKAVTSVGAARKKQFVCRMDWQIEALRIVHMQYQCLVIAALLEVADMVTAYACF